MISQNWDHSFVFDEYKWRAQSDPSWTKMLSWMMLLLLQVAERALFLWNNEHIENLIKQNRNVILPIIFPALEKNGRSHWNQAVHSLSLNIRKIFSDADPELVEECLLKFQEDEAKMEEIKRKQETTWKRLEEIAASKAVSGKQCPAWTLSKHINEIEP